VMAAARSFIGRIRRALHRPRLWRATAALSALLFGGLLVAAAQGSISVIARRPPAPGGSAAPPWERSCASGQVRQDRRRLAYCARADGLVLTSTHGPGLREVHVAIICDFHLVIVRLPDGSATPSFGARLVVVGPLLRARNGQRELQAFEVGRE
jgi:hypothetical protein